MNPKPLIETHPGILEQVKDLMSAGMSKSAIAKHLGISRDRLRTFLQKNGLDNKKPTPQISEVQLNEIVQMYMDGKPWDEVTAVTGFSLHMIRTHINKYGLDLSQISATHRLHRWDGRVFGSWTVVPGTTGINGHGTVMTECVCGKQVMNLKSNLLSGASQSCGCIGLKKDTVGHDSTHYQWTCLETGEVVETTLALSKQLNVNSQGLYRRAFKQEDFEDHLGYTWHASQYQRENVGRRDLTPDLDFIRYRLDDGKSFVAIAKELDVELAHMYKFAAKHGLSSNYKPPGRSGPLDEAQVQSIRQMHIDGAAAMAISAELDLKPNVIYNLLKGKS